MFPVNPGRLEPRGQRLSEAHLIRRFACEEQFLCVSGWVLGTGQLFHYGAMSSVTLSVLSYETPDDPDRSEVEVRLRENGTTARSL
jgi:hypothetical protein